MTSPDTPGRTRIEEGGTGRRALDLAEVLAPGVHGKVPSEHPERLAARPTGPSRTACWATAASAACPADAGAALGRRRRA
ncbi:hypothetical protein [Streptomyces sp. AF1A]|jgi:hypothetical protein|uniref:hypothetical protein n=1 Tax=Streptomyces sp. AF1A TaxID=3394350 RepID=UPI0039BCF188